MRRPSPPAFLLLRDGRQRASPLFEVTAAEPGQWAVLENRAGHEDVKIEIRRRPMCHGLAGLANMSACLPSPPARASVGVCPAPVLSG